MQAVLNASVQQQRARILVPAIVQGLTRRPAASDAGVLHVQGAPAFALSIPQTSLSLVRSGTAFYTAQRNSVLLRGGGRRFGSSQQPEPVYQCASAGGGGLALARWLSQRQRQHLLAAANVAKRTSAALAMVDFSDRDERAEFRERQRSLPARGRAPMAAGTRC